MPSVAPNGTIGGHSSRPLTGAAAESARKAKAQREADAAAARAIAPLAGLMIELVGLDTIRARLGRDRALQVCALAGLDAERIGGNWAAAEPQQRQVSVAGPHAVDDQLDADAKLTPDDWRLPYPELNAKRIALAREAEQERQAAREAARATMPSGFPDSGLPVAATGQELHREADGNLSVRRANGQTSVTYSSWEKLHAEDALSRRYLGAGQAQAPAPSSSWAAPASASVLECDHSGATPYCGACGMPTAPQPAEA